MPSAVDAHHRGRLAILAGYGSLPLHVAQAAAQAGEDPFIIALKNEADADFSAFGCQTAAIGDARLIQSIIAREGIRRIILSGGVRRRPEMNGIRPTFSALIRLPRILQTLLSGGDDAVLRMVIQLFEGMGCTVCSVQDVAPDIVAKAGRLGTVSADKSDITNIQIAASGAQMLGQLDVGQGAVCVGGRIVALEAAEGTDAMLARVAELRNAGRISTRRKGVLVKLCKPQQDLRADLPTIGPATIREAIEAGLAGIAIEAGRSLFVDQAEALSIADSNGLFVYGLDLAVQDLGLRV